MDKLFIKRSFGTSNIDVAETSVIGQNRGDSYRRRGSTLYHLLTTRGALIALGNEKELENEPYKKLPSEVRKSCEGTLEPR